MSRRPVNPTARRFAESTVIPSTGPFHQKSRSSPLLSIGLVLLGAFLLLGYSYSGSGTTNKENSGEERNSEDNGVVSCTHELRRAIPILHEVYGDSMHKVLHVGPDTCSVMSKLLKEEDTEAWGVEPFDLIYPLESSCKNLIRRGIVRVADIKFPLPYKEQSFSTVLVSDAPDSLSPKYLNKTLPDLARVSANGLVLFVGHPGQQSSSKMTKLVQHSKAGRPAKLRNQAWWKRNFEVLGLKENQSMTKKFEQVQMERSYKPRCQIFHLIPDLLI